MVVRSADSLSGRRRIEHRNRARVGHSVVGSDGDDHRALGKRLDDAFASTLATLEPVGRYSYAPALFEESVAFRLAVAPAPRVSVSGVSVIPVGAASTAILTEADFPVVRLGDDGPRCRPRRRLTTPFPSTVATAVLLVEYVHAPALPLESAADAVVVSPRPGSSSLP